MKINDPSLLQEAQKIKPTNVINIVNPKPVIKIKPAINSNKTNLSSGIIPATTIAPAPEPAYAPVHSPVHSPVYAPHAQPTHSNQHPYQFVSPPGAPPSRPTGPRNIIRGNKGSAIFNSISSSASLPTCGSCSQLIRGPFVSAVGKIWCPHHFVCANPSCGISLQDIGFVEENGKLYCERDFETYLAPTCNKCNRTILGECCYALDKTFHPECFTCSKCKQKIGSGKFHIEDGVPYCEKDFVALFSVKCSGCQFPIEAGDKFVEALGQKYHAECFTCTQCNVPLSNGFVAKGNKPYCKRHAY